MPIDGTAEFAKNAEPVAEPMTELMAAPIDSKYDVAGKAVVASINRMMKAILDLAGPNPQGMVGIYVYELNREMEIANYRAIQVIKEVQRQDAEYMEQAALKAMAKGIVDAPSEG